MQYPAEISGLFFQERKNVEFPRQIELFSRAPDFFSEEQLKHLTPIPVEEGLSYLSVILLNDEYYRYTVEYSEFSNDMINLPKTVYFRHLSAKSILYPP